MAMNQEIEKLERRWRENPLGLTFAPLAEAYRKGGEGAKALELLEVGLAQHQNYVPAHIVRGRCYLDAQSNAQAEQAFRRVVELDPENAIALKGLAEIAESEGRFSEAVGRLELLLEVDRNNEEARGQLDRLREQMVAPSSLGTVGVHVAEADLLEAAPSSEFQHAEEPPELSPSGERFPEIVLQAEVLEQGLPEPEAAQGLDLLAGPDPDAARGMESLADPPDQAMPEPADAGPPPAPEEYEAEVEPESPPAKEAVLDAEPMYSWEPVAEPIAPSEPIWGSFAEPTPPPPPVEPVPVPLPEPELLSEPVASEPEPEPEPELEPEPESVGEAEQAAAGPEPDLVVTETMAEIFLRQGHRELALAVYTQLAQRDASDERLSAAVARLQAELAPAMPAPAPEEPPVVEAAPRYDAASTGGRSVAAFFASVLSAVRPAVASPIHPPAFETSRRPAGEPTRPAQDSLSLSSVFGEDAPLAPAGAPIAPATQEPSFEQFFSPAEGPTAEMELPRGPEPEAPAMSSMAPEDLEQFNAWLRGLKR